MAEANHPFSVAGQRALIVGGTRGIGRAIALQLARQGARVLANYVRDQAAAEYLKREAVAAELDLDVFQADVTQPKGLDHLIETVPNRFSRLSILVFAAATGVHHPVEKLSLRHFDWTFALNVRAFFELVRRLLPWFDQPASVVAISSEGAMRAVPQYSLVGASKGALESMVRHFAVELAPRGIRVNTLAPGTVHTDAWKVLPDAERRLAEATRRTPRGRLNTLEEVAWAAQFLCSEAAAGIAGHTMVVDGGARIVE
jgi:NAD(P)-dependent dehydrogenase (short-subunit alcohol dehydrogenase family)